MNRVDTAIHRIQDLRPKDFTLSNLDDELASMTLIRSLTEEYSAFASSLLLMDKLEKATIQQAFVTEESQCRHRASAAPNIASALAATSSRTPARSTAECEFCGRLGHVQASLPHLSTSPGEGKGGRQSWRLLEASESQQSVKGGVFGTMQDTCWPSFVLRAR